MLCNIIFASLTFSLSTVYANAVPNPPTVDLGYARYLGHSESDKGVTSFRGIYYAAPPIGPLRWAAPVPIEHTGRRTQYRTINATVPGPQCVQGQTGWQTKAAAGLASGPPNVSPMSEDCLLLDVIVPSNPVSRLLPVIFQIHGGGYITGNSSSSDGTNLVSYSNGSVIYVQIQYRLGAYGFLGGHAVKKQGVLNAGLLDQRMALHWVQKHIAAFGGDPARVTIWGGSAGGGSVLYQLLRGGGEESPPFRAAISEYPGLLPHHSKATQEAQYQGLLNASKCRSLQCLRNLPFNELARATQQSYLDAYSLGLYGYGDFYYQPVVDGGFVQDLPSRELAKGHFSRVPLLVDHDAFEGLGFTNTSVLTPAELKHDLTVFWPAASANFLKQLGRLYPAKDYQGGYFTSNNLFSSPLYPTIASVLGAPSESATPYWQLEAIWGDVTIKCPTRFIARAAANAGIPTWKLNFNSGYYAHGATGPYLLGDALSALRFNDTLANIMRDYWLSFVVNLDPNYTARSKDRRTWSEYTSRSSVLQVNDTSLQEIADADASEQCEFLAANSAIVRV